ncbi:phospholipase A2 hemilipin-like isoform X2 [Ischnura elegans]|uniref:phospholipase A2 hemilipin-like isoform X2 n=1 Tax=Ischnura elegans TaxID=197161 RepID=UPI001ED8AE18|nr:phospholipase A2 hemilipin-like isoform X2 [Ischnura elegans]
MLLRALLAGFVSGEMTRCRLVLLLLAVASVGLATLRPPRLPSPPWRDRRPRLFDWGAEDAEAERVGEEAIGGMLDGWERLVTGVGATVGGVVDRVREGVDRVRKGVGDVAEGVQRAVSGAAHDAGDVIGSVTNAANPAIFPGTNWCGVGDRASRHNETGVFKLADACCRDHDSCPDSIGAGESKHGVKNEGLYTVSLCKCDRAFYRCLKDSDSIVAQNIGFMFFNILKLKCFTYDYPLTCKKESSAHHCEEYNAKSTAKKVWQLVDNPSY